MSYLSVWLFLLQIANTVPVPDSPGVYFRQDDRNWIGLPKALADSKMKGFDLFVSSGGYTNLNADLVLPGAKSSIRITIPRPIFFVRELGRPQDVMLIRLTQRKQSRTFHTSSGRETVENKGGFRKGDIRKIAIAKNPDNTLSITPEENLKPGEYLLVLGDANASFDFGVDLPR
jgi:hypothetical protein